ncbi:S1 RNA-binding domain-containing protein [Bacillus horti]|uniref:RNA-binding protein (Virulence factor B family) n=1 Tax=Caldalkalibacillus horti TaxID=77523 RepID=A0ABT9VT17_9BACI|nr:S1-like domain-containing RNA-binding protein [Bacillus horti]MDQ0164128.1 putative RNA-binding protein (virulence factor B family) [Bacillus horti]
MTTLQAGTFEELQVTRQADFGYFLTNGYEDVLLHQSEVDGAIEVDQNVRVFLYHDHQNRLAATMTEPKIELGQKKWLNVIDTSSKNGVYLDMGLKRDLLLPYSECPPSRDEWPVENDELYVYLTHDKQGRMLAKLVPTETILSEAKAGQAELLNTKLTGRVYKQFPDGAFLLSEKGHVIFLPRTEIRGELRLGQQLTVRITFVREDGRMNASLKESKEKAMTDDSQTILDYLEQRGGSMPYHDKTPPDVIQQKLGMSKAAFKRALGKLMKERKIVQKDGWTQLLSSKE